MSHRAALPWWDQLMERLDLLLSELHHPENEPMPTIADDFASITSADANLVAAQTGVTTAQAALVAAQTADTAADAQLSLDLQSSGPVYIVNEDQSASFLSYSPTAPGFVVTTAQPAGSVNSTVPPSPATPTS